MLEQKGKCERQTAETAGEAAAGTQPPLPHLSGRPGSGPRGRQGPSGWWAHLASGSCKGAGGERSSLGLPARWLLPVPALLPSSAMPQPLNASKYSSLSQIKPEKKVVQMVILTQQRHCLLAFQYHFILPAPLHFLPFSSPLPRELGD